MIYLLVSVQVGEVGYDGLLDIPFLRQITFTIDIQYETLWVSG